MNKEFFIKNRKKYLEQCVDKSLSVFFSGRVIQKTADQDYDFEVEKNFYYLTGINQDNVIFAILKNGDYVQEALFIEKNDPVLVKWVGRKLEIEEASEISGIKNVYYLESFEGFIHGAFNNTRYTAYDLKYLFLNLERRNQHDYTNPALEYAKAFRKKHPDINILNAYDLVIGLRMVKSEEEISLIQESIKTTKLALEEILKNSRPGIYEFQLETYFDNYIKYHGQKDLAFKTIAAAGKNATILHYSRNNNLLQDDEMILFDLGCRTNFYVSDITRTYPINGRFTKRQKEVYQAVLDVNKKCIEFLKPGVTWGEYNNYAKELLAQACIDLGLIKEPKELIKYYFHSIGHFIGLDTHDPGLHSYPLQAGMVITVEPGLYIEEEGIGVRIEDDVLITENGSINLSKDIIKEIDEIEKFMATK